MGLIKVLSILVAILNYLSFGSLENVNNYFRDLT